MNTNQNVNQNGGIESTIPVINNKKSVGRPRFAKRNIYLEIDSNTPRLRGKPTNGKQYRVVTVERAVKNTDYRHGVTPIFGEEVKAVNRPFKPRVKVNVINPQIQAEAPNPDSAPVNQAAVVTV